MAREIIREYTLQNLHCPQCASKIEAKINQSKGMDATINFVAKTLKIRSDCFEGEEELLRHVQDIVHEYEPMIQVGKAPTDARKAKIPTKKALLKEKKKEVYILSAAGVLFVLGLILNGRTKWYWILFFAGYLLSGGEVLFRAGRNILRGQLFDENFLMSLATIGALIIGEYAEAVAVMIFYQVGEGFQDLAVERSRRSIAALMDIRPEYANRIVEGKLIKTDPKQLQTGDEFIVKAGEKVPLDGVVVKGESFLDTSALTGESCPRAVQAGQQILSGSVNQTGLLVVRAEKKYEDSTVAKILELVENAASKKAPTEKFITKFAKVYTPVVVSLAAALALIAPVLLGQSFQTWIYRALLFLVISCPCALVISVPLGFFGGIGAASKNGILIKGTNYLEALSKADSVVFDKTGTLTEGVFALTKIEARNGFSERELLYYAAAAETYSNHPIALSIQKAYGKTVAKQNIENYTELPGMGVVADIEGKNILAGNEKLMEHFRIVAEKPTAEAAAVHIAVDGRYGGYVVIADEVKKDAKNAIDLLRQMGIDKVVMLTGDVKSTAEHFAQMLGIKHVKAQLLPQEKVEAIERLKMDKATNGQTVFVGDGINDAPALAVADVGIAMGALGSDAAVEAADVVVMSGGLMQVVKAVEISRRTKKIVKQNIVFALGVKVAVLILGATGFAGMWEAVFADVGVALLAVANSMRALKG